MKRSLAGFITGALLGGWLMYEPPATKLPCPLLSYSYYRLFDARERNTLMDELLATENARRTLLAARDRAELEGNACKQFVGRLVRYR